MTLVLHQWEISPFCGKVRRVLRLKKLAFEVIDYNGIRARQAKGLSASGKLPVLEVGGDRIEDSSAIAAYLDREHPEPPLWPAAAADRHLAHFFEDWADESLYWFEVYLRFAVPEARERAVEHLCAGRPAWERAVFRRVIVGMYRRKLAAQGLGRYGREEVERRLLAHLDHLEGHLAGREHLACPRASIADIAVASQLAEIQRTSTLADRIADGRPALAAWLERWAEPA
jgi:glutathione S-transferase